MEESPSIAKQAVFIESKEIPNDTPIVKGYDWSKGLNYHELLKSYATTGFQATNFHQAVDEINKMVSFIC